jgi:hypothetical protein
MSPDSPLSQRLYSPEHNLNTGANPNPESASEIQSNADSDANSNYESEPGNDMPLPPEDRFGSE